MSHRKYRGPTNVDDEEEDLEMQESNARAPDREADEAEFGEARPVQGPSFPPQHSNPTVGPAGTMGLAPRQNTIDSQEGMYMDTRGGSFRGFNRRRPPSRGQSARTQPPRLGQRHTQQQASTGGTRPEYSSVSQNPAQRRPATQHQTQGPSLTRDTQSRASLSTRREDNPFLSPNTDLPQQPPLPNYYSRPPSSQIARQSSARGEQNSVPSSGHRPENAADLQSSRPRSSQIPTPTPASTQRRLDLVRDMTQGDGSDSLFRPANRQPAASPSDEDELPHRPRPNNSLWAGVPPIITYNFARAIDQRDPELLPSPRQIPEALIYGIERAMTQGSDSRTLIDDVSHAILQGTRRLQTQDQIRVMLYGALIDVQNARHAQELIIARAGQDRHPGSTQTAPESSQAAITGSAVRDNGSRRPVPTETAREPIEDVANASTEGGGTTPRLSKSEAAQLRSKVREVYKDLLNPEGQGDLTKVKCPFCDPERMVVRSKLLDHIIREHRQEFVGEHMPEANGELAQRFPCRHPGCPRQKNTFARYDARRDHESSRHGIHTKGQKCTLKVPALMRRTLETLRNDNVSEAGALNPLKGRVREAEMGLRQRDPSYQSRHGLNLETYGTRAGDLPTSRKGLAERLVEIRKDSTAKGRLLTRPREEGTWAEVAEDLEKALQGEGNGEDENGNGNGNGNGNEEGDEEEEDEDTFGGMDYEYDNDDSDDADYVDEGEEKENM